MREKYEVVGGTEEVAIFAEAEEGCEETREVEAFEGVGESEPSQGYGLVATGFE